MKIMQVMPDFGIGGAEIMCESLVYELIRLGHDVVVVSMFDFHSIITERMEAKKIRIIYLDKKVGIDISLVKKFKRLLEKECPDVIHTHRNALQYVAPAAKMVGKIPCVHTIHNVAKMENPKFSRIINKHYFKTGVALPVALSEEVFETVKSEYGLKANDVPIVVNGIDLSNCIEKQSYRSNEKFTIIHVGRFSEQKNHHGLIEAFSMVVDKNPSVRLWLVGDGELKAEISELICKCSLEDKVELLGARDDVNTLLNRADAFILPSLYEGVPMSLIEAMGTGLPIVATAVGGVPDMLANGNDAILTQIDVNEISQGLIKLINDEKLREKLGINAKMRAKAFSASQMALDYVNLYRKK